MPEQKAERTVIIAGRSYAVAGDPVDSYFEGVAEYSAKKNNWSLCFSGSQ
jgi:hypothetical protein